MERDCEEKYESIFETDCRLPGDMTNCPRRGVQTQQLTPVFWHTLYRPGPR